MTNSPETPIESHALPAKGRTRLIGRMRISHMIILALIFYSVLHLGFSIARYSIFSGIYSGDFNRALSEASQLKEAGRMPLTSILYPPMYYVLLWPFLNVDIQIVDYVFYFGQLILYFVSVILMVKAVSLRRRPQALEYIIAAVLTVNFSPFLETVAMHKVEGIEFFLICLAIYAFRNKKDMWTGAIIFIAANLKYLPGVLAVYFILKRQWKIVRGLLVALFVYLLVLIPIIGIDHFISYGVRYPVSLLIEHKHEGTNMRTSREFQTLSGTINRLFVGSVGITDEAYLKVPHAGVASAIAAALKMLFIVLYLYFIRHRWRVAERDDKWPFYLMEMSITLVMIFVIAQASRVNYGILLLPAFVITALLLYQNWHIFHMKEKVLFALSYSLTGMAIPGGILNRLPPHPLWGQKHTWAYMWMSLPFYGYLLLGLCIVICYYRLLHVSDGVGAVADRRKQGIMPEDPS